MKLWTLTVDDSDSIHTSIHLTEGEAVTCLFDNYDDENEFSSDDIQALLDARGLIVHIDQHDV